MAKTAPFDEHPDRYEQWFVDNWYVYRSELRAVEALIPARGRGVEIGMGSGRFAEPLAITDGVEPSASMRALAAGRGLRARDGVAEALPLEDESYDFALMVTTICFVDDPGAAFREIGRVLREGGSIIVGFVDGSSPLGKLYQSRKERSVFYGAATFFSTEEILALLQESGFRRTRVVQTVFGSLPEITTIQEPRDGWGVGGFVAIRAAKRPAP